jgi:hypothetical protein
VQGALDPGAELLTATAIRQKRLVDALDIDTTILHSFNAVSDLDELACGCIWISEDDAR